MNLIRSSTISRFSLSMAMRRAERPRGSTQLMLIKPVSAALMRILCGEKGETGEGSGGRCEEVREGGVSQLRLGEKILSKRKGKLMVM